jgi:hypothetical protein
MNDARQGEVIRSFLSVVRDEFLQPDGVDFTLGVILMEERLDILQAPFGLELMVPTSVDIGQDLETGPAALRDVVLLSGVDEYLSLWDGFTSLVYDPDIDGSPGSCEA